MKTCLTLCLLLFFRLQTYAQVSLISIDSLLKRIEHRTDSNEILVYNFWATWCGPCIEELPLFQQADSLLKDRNIHFIFVSMDGPAKLKKVNKFCRANMMPGTQYLLNSYDLNTFIPAVDPYWQGSIPYTIVMKAGKRKNHEFNFENLNALLRFINN